MKEVLSAAAIADRIAALGRDITAYYSGQPLTVIVIANGAMIFGADLCRAVALPLQIDSVAVASYSFCSSTGVISWRSEPKLECRDRHVLLLDEVLDSGRTLLAVKNYFSEHGARSVRTAVLVEKAIARPEGLAHADWSGFTLDDQFLVGYGLDCDEEFRNLPYVALLEPGDAGK